MGSHQLVRKTQQIGQFYASVLPERQQPIIIMQATSPLHKKSINIKDLYPHKQLSRSPSDSQAGTPCTDPALHLRRSYNPYQQAANHPVTMDAGFLSKIKERKGRYRKQEALNASAGDLLELQSPNCNECQSSEVAGQTQPKLEESIGVSIKQNHQNLPVNIVEFEDGPFKPAKSMQISKEQHRMQWRHQHPEPRVQEKLVEKSTHAKFYPLSPKLKYMKTSHNFCNEPRIRDCQRRLYRQKLQQKIHHTIDTKIVKLTPFISKIKIFDEICPLNPKATLEAKPIASSYINSKMGPPEPHPAVQHLSPYQLALHRKNVHLINMKLKSLGSQADQNEKMYYQELQQILCEDERKRKSKASQARSGEGDRVTVIRRQIQAIKIDEEGYKHSPRCRTIEMKSQSAGSVQDVMCRTMELRKSRIPRKGPINPESSMKKSLAVKQTSSLKQGADLQNSRPSRNESICSTKMYMYVENLKNNQNTGFQKMGSLEPPWMNY